MLLGDNVNDLLLGQCEPWRRFQGVHPAVKDVCSSLSFELRSNELFSNLQVGLGVLKQEVEEAARSWAVKAVVFGLPPGGGAGSIPAAGIPGVAPRAGSLPRSWLPGRVYGITCARQRRPRRFPDLLRTVRQGFSDRDPARTRRGGFFPHGFPLLVLQGRPGHVSQQEKG